MDRRGVVLPPSFALVSLAVIAVTRVMYTVRSACHGMRWPSFSTVGCGVCIPVFR